MATWDNKDVVNVWHYNLGSTTLDSTVADAITADLTTFYNRIKAYVFSGNSYAKCVITDLRTEGGPQFIVLSGLPDDGTSGADPLPGQNAALITWTTAFRGKEGRGRTYLGGFTESAITSGVLTSGLVSAFETGIDDILGHPFTVLSRVKDNVLRDEGVHHNITDGTIHTHMATQRNRSFLR